MDELANSHETVEQKLIACDASAEASVSLTQAQFRWQMNEDAMATEKLAEGIRNFTIDQIKLEKQLAALL
jgi:transaldolase